MTLDMERMQLWIIYVPRGFLHNTCEMHYGQCNPPHIALVHNAPKPMQHFVWYNALTHLPFQTKVCIHKVQILIASLNTPPEVAPKGMDMEQIDTIVNDEALRDVVGCRYRRNYDTTTWRAKI